MLKKTKQGGRGRGDDMKRDRDDGPERRPFQDLSRIPIAKPECKVQKEKSEKSYDDFTLFCHKTSLYDGDL